MNEQALQAYFNSAPEFAAEYERVRRLGEKKTPTQWLAAFLAGSPAETHKFNNFISQQQQQAANPQPADGSAQAVPLEQALLDQSLQDYILPDLQADAARRAQGQGILDKYNAAIDEAIRQNQGNINGNRLNDEYAMAADVLSRGQSALAPLAQERLNLADTQVAGINQALEGQRDQINAQDALSGFVGGSSMKDAELARAAIGARQQSAAVMGGAKVQNATDYRSLLDAEAANRKAYFDNDWTRRTQAALLPASLQANRLSLAGAADDYGQSGLRRSLNTLSWWQGNGATNPQYTTYQTQANTAGNDIANLGASLFKTSARDAVSGLKNWWNKGSSSAPTAADWNPYGVTG